jgi:hypothetical protein
MKSLSIAVTPVSLLACDGDRSRGVQLPCLASVLSVFVVAGLWAIGRDQLLRMAIPVMATVIGAALYFSRPILYIQFTLWVWFLAPFVRRVVDWRFGYADPNLILVAPLLVSALAGLTVVIPRGRGSTRIPAAFVLGGSAIAYGFVVGMILHPSAETVYGLCNWLCPMLFGLHLYLNWPQFDEHRVAITKTFLWGLLILGLYGAYQYFSPPAWDRYWLANVMMGGQNESFGRPEALQVRVWSTMNSPGPFANVILAGVFVLFTVRSSWKLPSLIAGYLSLLLSLARTVWLAWLVGLFVLLRKSRARIVARVLISVILLGACLLPLINDRRVASVLEDRVKTFTDLGHDESFGARLEMYRTLAVDVIEHPFGYGVSNEKTVRDQAIDSGVLALFFSLGWFGGLLYIAATACMFLNRPSALQQSNQFAAACRAVVIALLAQVIAGNIFVGINGTLFWTFGAVYLAYPLLQSVPHHSPRVLIE